MALAYAFLTCHSRESGNLLVICDALGPDLSKEFIELKRMEWVEYSRHVSEWELNRYVEFF